MILVILGTQDKEFPRLLEAVDKCIEEGTIKDKVVVQAGQTHYESANMEILDLLPAPEFEELVDKADLIITHGGAGSILMSIKKGKKIIAAPRLAKYGEHHNDHQKQIISEFAKGGYVLELDDFNKLGELIKKSQKFKQKRFESNTKNMIKLLENYIEDTNHTSWFNKFGYLLGWVILGVINFLLFFLLFSSSMNIYLLNLLVGLISGVIFLGWQKLFHYKFLMRKMVFVFVILMLDMILMFSLLNVFSIGEMLSKLIVIIILFVFNIFINKFSFNK